MLPPSSPATSAPDDSYNLKMSISYFASRQNPKTIIVERAFCSSPGNGDKRFWVHVAPARQMRQGKYVHIIILKQFRDIYESVWRLVRSCQLCKSAFNRPDVTSAEVRQFRQKWLPSGFRPSGPPFTSGMGTSWIIVSVHMPFDRSWCSGWPHDGHEMEVTSWIGLDECRVYANSFRYRGAAVPPIAVVWNKGCRTSKNSSRFCQEYKRRVLILVSEPNVGCLPWYNIPSCSHSNNELLSGIEAKTSVNKSG